MWLRRAISQEIRNSSLTLVNLWERFSLANSKANCLHLARHINLNLYGTRLTFGGVSSGIDDEVGSVMKPNVADLKSLSTSKYFHWSGTMYK